MLKGINVKAEIAIEGQTRQNFDLDDAIADDLTEIKPRVRVAIEAEPADALKFVLETEAEIRLVIEDDLDDVDRQKKAEIKQAYVALHPWGDDADLRLGRQQIDDEMQWLIDEEVDGGRLLLESGRFALDASVTRRAFVDLAFPDEEEEEVTNYFVIGRYDIGEKSFVAPYVFFRDGEEREDEDELLFLGVQSVGRISSQLRYWLNAAYLTGERRNRDISAFGGDVGLTYVFDEPYEPSVTAGFAYGSGDDDLSDGKDGNFRQTGLHDNDYRINSLVRFHYLGELLNPEISNLMIFTGGVGVRPSEKASIDLVYHYYRQVEADDDLETNLEIDPDGEHKEIGHEVDLILGYREIEHVSLEVALGAFFPGDAFPASADEAYFANVELKLNF